MDPFANINPRVKARVLTWEDISLGVKKIGRNLEAWVEATPKPKIVAIARGGLIPATMLSHYLNVPLYHVLTAKSHTGTKHSGQTLLSEAAAIPQKAIKDCIFVDDILDTGGTFTQILGRYSGARFVTLVTKQTGFWTHKENLHVDPSFYVADETWIKFPWEA